MHIFLKKRFSLFYSSTLREHPGSKVSFCLLKWGGENKALPESRQTFEVAEARTAGLVNLVLSRQTRFSSISIRLLINQWS